VVIIGIDGAAHQLVRTWLEDGLLPHMEGLVGGGFLTVLRSTNPPITFPAIPSFCTGKGPGGHGISCFFRPKLDRSMGLVSSKDLKGEFWNLEGMADRGKIIVNLPLTFPAKPINGIVVTGPLTPSKDDPGFMYPPGKAVEHGDLLDAYAIDVEDRYLAGGEEPYMEACEGVMRARTALFTGLLQREAWEVAIVYYTILDRVQHNLFGKDDNRWLKRAYASVDAEVGRILSCLDEGTHVLLFSDHGFGPSKGRFHPNAWLEAKGFLRYIRSNPLMARGLRVLPKDVVRRSADRVSRSGGAYDPGSVDWDATLAYASINGIYLNEGVVDDGEAVLARIVDQLSGLKGRDGGTMDVSIWRRDEVYDGDLRDRMPHLLYSIDGYGFEPFPSFERGEFLRYFDKESKGWHREEGVLIASGPDFTQGPVAELGITDIAPTLLHLLGCPVPERMDGAVVREVFRQGSRPSEDGTVHTDVDHEEAKRLRGTIGRIAGRDHP
jgi:predicted AlkP superfamily phosphohydrolase/phosphomutase